MIMMQGHGKIGVWDIDTPALIRYGQLTHDAFFSTKLILILIPEGEPKSFLHNLISNHRIAIKSGHDQKVLFGQIDMVGRIDLFGLSI